MKGKKGQGEEGGRREAPGLGFEVTAIFPTLTMALSPSDLLGAPQARQGQPANPDLLQVLK